jgi:hypothetical protein
VLEAAQKPWRAAVRKFLNQRGANPQPLPAQNHVFGQDGSFPKKDDTDRCDRDKFRGSDHPEGGQTSQYKRVYRYQSVGLTYGLPVFPPESVKASGEQLPRNRLPGTNPNVFRVEHWSRFVRVVVQLAGSPARRAGGGK